MVLGLSPHRPFDAQYRKFIDLVGDQLGTALAEIDRAMWEKIVFNLLSNGVKFTRI